MSKTPNTNNGTELPSASPAAEGSTARVLADVREAWRHRSALNFEEAERCQLEGDINGERVSKARAMAYFNCWSESRDAVVR